MVHGPAKRPLRLGVSKGIAIDLTLPGIQAVLTNTSFTATTNAAWFTCDSRTFVALNDGIRGFNGSTDSIIEMTGLTGSMANLTIV
jgi:hypothetical protein